MHTILLSLPILFNIHYYIAITSTKCITQEEPVTKNLSNLKLRDAIFGND